MTRFVLPIVVVGLLLTSVAVGSVKMQDKGGGETAACTGPTASGEFEAATMAFWEGREVAPLNSLLAENVGVGEGVVLGAADESKWIEVDLSDQTLKAIQGGSTLMETKISTGKRQTPTPTGEFRIWLKLRYTKMSGGVKGTSSYYYLPNVPYTMFFYNDQYPQWKGYGLHGTYWHNNFGTPMSHGCVNLPTDMAGVLFNLTDPQLPAGKSVVRAGGFTDGTRLIIHE